MTVVVMVAAVALFRSRVVTSVSKPYIDWSFVFVGVGIGISGLTLMLICILIALKQGMILAVN